MHDVCAIRERVIYVETEKLPELLLSELVMNKSVHNFYNENYSQLYLNHAEFCSIKLFDSFLHSCHDPTNLKKDEITDQNIHTHTRIHITVLIKVFFLNWNYFRKLHALQCALTQFIY